MSQPHIQSVAVLGLGTMGHGIAQAFAAGGVECHLYDDVAAARATVVDRVRQNLVDFVHFELLAADEVTPLLSRLHVHDTLASACQGVQMVVEAVREDLDAKRALFAEIETCAADDTILASNSSSFPISQSGAKLRRPERALVTHWFNPPHIVPTVEIVPSSRTSESVVQATLDVHRRIGKLAIVIRRELPGFLVNRIQVALMREVWDLLDQGVASVEDIDTAIRGSMGFRLAALGPLRIHDFGGLDIQAAVYRNLCPEIRSNTDVPHVVEQIVSQGHYGFKTGRGFYDYPADAATAARGERDQRYLALLKLFHTRQSTATT